MLRKTREFLTGRRVITIPKDRLCAAFDLIYRNGLSFHGERRTRDGDILIKMTERDALAFFRLAEERDVPLSLSAPHGLPVVVNFIKKRPVIAVGAVIMISWLLFSEQIVWDIRIKGNTKTPSSEIIATLEELGFGVGTFYPSVNFDKLHADYSAAQEDIAWLSVYMNGSVAEVEVREKYKDTRPDHDKKTYANVVAECAGVVRSVNVFEGQAAVKAGDTVYPGQVLISGVVEMKEENSARYEYAAGEVLCTVAEPINISSSIEREEKRYTGREKKEISVTIFKKTVNLFINGGKNMPSCDTIEEEKQIELFGKWRLPLWISTTTRREYSLEKVSYSPERVANEAVAALSDRLKALSESGTMIEKQLSAEFENGVYSVSGVVYFERDIGKTAEFTVGP